MDARRKVLDVLQGKSEHALEVIGSHVRYKDGWGFTDVDKTIRALVDDGCLTFKGGILALTEKGKTA